MRSIPFRTSCVRHTYQASTRRARAVIRYMFSNITFSTPSPQQNQSTMLSIPFRPIHISRHQLPQNAFQDDLVAFLMVICISFTGRHINFAIRHLESPISSVQQKVDLVFVCRYCLDVTYRCFAVRVKIILVWGLITGFVPSSSRPSSSAISVNNNSPIPDGLIAVSANRLINPLIPRSVA